MRLLETWGIANDEVGSLEFFVVYYEFDDKFRINRGDAFFQDISDDGFILAVTLVELVPIIKIYRLIIGLRRIGGGIVEKN